MTVTALPSGIRAIPSWRGRVGALPRSSRRILVAAGLLLLVFALVAPGIPVKAYRRYPTTSGVFSPPVDTQYVERACIVHVVSQVQQGDYYVECPWTEHALFYWSPIVALAGILMSSVAVAADIDRWTRRLSTVLEAAVGIEGMIIAFGTLLASYVLASIPGLLGYPIGFFAVLHSMRRMGARGSALVSAAVVILFVSGIVFFLMLVASIGMSEY